MNRSVLQLAFTAILLVSFGQDGAHASSPEISNWDVVVYGGSSAGVTAAIQAARMGRQVVLLNQNKHVGGMTSSGLGMTDVGNSATIGGLAAEFYHRIYQYYLDSEAWKQGSRADFIAGRNIEQTQKQFLFEPHAAQAVFDQMLKEAGVTVMDAERLDLKHGVHKEGTRIVSITAESGRVYAGKNFVDATYEGDLLAKAGVSYVVGRESNAEYGETLNGKFPKPLLQIKIDPFIIRGDRSSGLLPPAVPATPGNAGDGDDLVQTYNFRICLTDIPQNGVPISKPADFDPAYYELFARWMETRLDRLKPGPSRNGATTLGGSAGNLGINFDLIPNRKTDSNDGSHFGSDLAGACQNWPEADYAERQRIFARMKSYTLGLLWFLGNDPRVPEPVRAEASRWGLAKDEFTDSDNWPFQLYVREARRMVSDYVMTENDARGSRTPDDGVALASYPLDSHTNRYSVDSEGRLFREMGFFVGIDPFPVSYRSIRPRAAECSNLTVAGCIAASHAAYGSVRMEPVFMMLGQAAGAAAAIAAEEGVAVQDISYPSLRQRLLADNAILTPPLKATAK